MKRLSIIVPVLDEAEGLAAHLDALGAFRARGAEVIVVDGGSRDATMLVAATRADKVLSAPRGRARQMNAGARAAIGDVLLFLHADTRLPPEADRAALAALGSGDHAWGRFDVAIEGRSALLPLVAAMMNLRSRLTAIATGDQAIFVTRAAFERIGGFPDLPLMEDIALSRRLKRLSRPACLRSKATTSGRRWERKGVLATVLLMWRLRLSFFLGGDVDDLAVAYGYRTRDG